MIQSATSNMGHTEPVPVGDGVTRPSLDAGETSESTARGEEATDADPTATTTPHSSAPTATDGPGTTDDAPTTAATTPTLDRYEAGHSPESTDTRATPSGDDESESLAVRPSVYGAKQS
ncbi:MAG: hypothetical protein ABEI99_00740 [Halobaculum sp.]